VAHTHTHTHTRVGGKKFVWGLGKYENMLDYIGGTTAPPRDFGVEKGSAFGKALSSVHSPRVDGYSYICMALLGMVESKLGRNEEKCRLPLSLT